jgi:hypothetical protein
VVGSSAVAPATIETLIGASVHRHRHVASGFAFGLRSKIRVYRGFFSAPTQLLHTCPMQAVAAHAAHYQRLCGCRLGEHSAE